MVLAPLKLSDDDLTFDRSDRVILIHHLAAGVDGGRLTEYLLKVVSINVTRAKLLANMSVLEEVFTHLWSGVEEGLPPPLPNLQGEAYHSSPFYILVLSDLAVRLTKRSIF